MTTVWIVRIWYIAVFIGLLYGYYDEDREDKPYKIAFAISGLTILALFIASFFAT